VQAFEQACGKKLAVEVGPRREGDLDTVYAGDSPLQALNTHCAHYHFVVTVVQYTEHLSVLSSVLDYVIHLQLLVSIVVFVTRLCAHIVHAVLAPHTSLCAYAYMYVQ
jgi:hypothetical protein